MNIEKYRKIDNFFILVDCKWSKFSVWTSYPCTKTCGGGVKIMTRKRNIAQYPHGGGNDCNGANFEEKEEKCNENSCCKYSLI